MENKTAKVVNYVMQIYNEKLLIKNMRKQDTLETDFIL